MYERSARVLAWNIRNKLRELGIPSYPASSRDGFVFIMVEYRDKRLLVWIRTSPITSKALPLAKKIAGKYEKADLFVLEFYEEIDYAEGWKTLDIAKVKAVEEAVEEIRKRLE